MNRLLAFAATLAIAAGAHAQDPYDPAKMDLNPKPAKVTGARYTGAYAEGASLSFDAKLLPLDPSPVKTVRLDTTHKIVEIAPGVKFSAWTFGDQVPGPTIRARVGDRIKFVMTNRSDEAAPGVRLTAAPMMHSMDFHAAMVSPQDKYRSIAPGQTIEFEFTVNYPGIFMYHCGTPMILEHLAAGMYGAVVVEPRGGYPTRVDREYVVIQSEFYARPANGKGQGKAEGKAASGAKVQGGAHDHGSSHAVVTKKGEAPVYVLDTERLRTALPTHTVFNGQHNGMVKNPLKANPGERVRLYLLNVGPSRTSSFHVVGTIFDRVWWEGNPDNQMRGMQTVLLGSSNSAIVEFLIPEKGSYIMVDHHFANASQGAIGLIDAGGKAEEQELEHHNFPASATPTDPEAVKGKLAFESKCMACHTVGGGRKLGPDLAGVTRRRSESWLARWMKEPEKMLETDPEARKMLKEYNNLPMPNQNLPAAEIKQYLEYFKWYDKQAEAFAKQQKAKQAQAGGHAGAH